MKKIVCAVVSAALSFLHAPTFASQHQVETREVMIEGVSPQQAEEDRKAIEAVVAAYFDGIGTADAERLNRAFDAPNAAMIGVVKSDEGPRVQAFKEMEAVIANWAANTAPEGPGRDGEILDLVIRDGVIAMVMFRYKDEYYDVLSLVKVAGTWKIITKAYVQR